MFNFGIGGGALLGGLLLPGAGARWIPAVGGCIAVASVLVLISEPWLFRKK